MGQLAPSEIARFHDQGWVKPGFRLPTERVAFMREALDELIQCNPGVRPEKLVSAHIVENGCLRVIPGSHQARALHDHLHEDRADLTLNQRMAAGSFDESQAVDVELEAGEMSLHDVYMIHGARANTSTKRRTGVALRYMPATSVFRRGQNDFSVGHRPVPAR